MRIPSEFNDQNLYRRGQSRKTSGGSTRRLVRLVIGFALIIVVMNQAAKESFYRPFFGSDDVGDGAKDPTKRPVAPIANREMGDKRLDFDDSEPFAAELARVVDGSVWRGADFDAFYRSLHRAPLTAAANSTRVGVVPLLQQPDVFRGQRVRMVGKVARAEQMDARDNEFGIPRYWQLWLRPIGGADRPFVGIVEDVPKSVAAISSDAALSDGPQVELVGIYLKRLAYQSSVGADLAPVIVGRIEGTSNPDAAPEIATVSHSAPGQFDTRLGMTILAACLIGVSLAMVAMWRTAAMTRRSRELRSIGRPRQSEFLQQLDLSGNEEPR